MDDINDNQPKFLRRLFTGGVTTESDYGAEVITIQVRRAECGSDANYRAEVTDIQDAGNELVMKTMGGGCRCSAWSG